MISRRIAAKSRHALLHHPFGVLIYGIIVLIIEHTRHISSSGFLLIPMRPILIASKCRNLMKPADIIQSIRLPMQGMAPTITVSEEHGTEKIPL